MEGIPVEGFRAEVEIGGAELFGLTEEQISAGFQIEMQSLHQRGPLGAREVGQYVHAENAVKAPNVDRLGQIHGIESDQTSQARLHQQIRAVSVSIPVPISISVPVWQPFLSAIRSPIKAADFRKTGANGRRRQSG